MLGSAMSGLVTGTLLGLLGGGGSIIAVPILIYFVGLEAKAAIATSLVIVGLASLLAAWSHYRKQTVVVSTALIFGAIGGVGSFSGARLAQLVPDTAQLILFALSMVIMALLMLRQRHDSSESNPKNSVALPVVLLAGFCAGIFTGLIGVGGGFIIVPVFTMLLRMPMRKAIGTSLLVIGINSLVGAFTYSSKLSLNLSAFPFAIATLSSAPLAARLAHYVPQEKLKVGFAISLLFLSIWMLTKQVFH